LLNQVEDLKAAVLIFPGDRDDQAQVGRGHLAPGLGRKGFADEGRLMRTPDGRRRLIGLALDLPETSSGGAQTPFDFAPVLRFFAELLLQHGDLALEGANLPCDRADRIYQSPPRLVAQPEPRDLRGDIHARARDPAFEAHRFLRFVTMRWRALVL